ncbi:hbdH1 [Symbiodinium necroappetens]|uniref:HbdH1 protein n=1 Tax=Symbiodinium necroappetens TaxID=1628268 RepID=A0A813AJX2_9DINO|nr:hbdH1 [Symbiodinium necroappetens]
MPKPIPYYEAQTPSFENGMLAQLSRCTLVHGEESTQAKVAVAVVAVLQCLPLASLVACLLHGVWVHLLKGGSASVKLGAVPVELETIEAIDAKAADLQDQIRHSRLESSPKVKFQLWMEFVVFLLDYLSDYNCLRTFVVEEAYGVAAVQGVIIAVPVALDFYRGKLQPVQVFGGFVESRKRGFPTDDFILALRSEKSVEAPLSMFLQFYTLLRSTRCSSIWSLCISMPLSILGIAKHVHATFELQVLEVLARHPTQPSQPELQTTPQHRPGHEPASGPWRSGGDNLSMQGPPRPPDSMQVIPALPPGIAPRAELLPTLPPGIAPLAGPAAMRGSRCPPPDSMQVIPALPAGIAPRSEPLPTLPPGIPPVGALLPITVEISKAKDTE